MTDQLQDITPTLPPNKLAFVIDNRVVDVLHTDDRLAAIFLSDPLIVDATMLQGDAVPEVNDSYDPRTGQFQRTSESPSMAVGLAAAAAIAANAPADGQAQA